MASLLRSVATTTAASAIQIAIAFSSSSSSSPTNPKPHSLNFSRPSPRGLGLARPLLALTWQPSQLLIEDGVMPQLLTEFMVNMKCEGCVNAVKSKLETIEGIEKVDVDLANQVVRILGSSPVKTMSQALEQTGRKARLIGQGVPQANQQTDGVIRHVFRISSAGVCDGDAAAVALGEVDVVGADAGADDELERREAGEKVGVDLEPADADDGSDGGGVTGEEDREWV
ncbi:hypothetical protein F2Q68_00042460 [Brassica cretica]|uniref:HMA domain-containing protein n=1 Tax=Brassica cretica TaxID=69181 RepID=A0A8S9MJR1_BRACR|nr:hypothetical protein F2Q68_00042460 [Brassica cretica]